MSLTMSGVTLTFPDGAERITALDNVDLSIYDGSFVTITGPSGSGKSSLLAVAGTLIRPDSGAVLIDDTDVSTLSEAHRARIRRERIGIVFQGDHLIASLTVVDQLLLRVDLQGRLRRAERRRYRKQAIALLDEVGLGHVVDRLPGELSGGMRQRVNIARALMGEPTLLLIDEPTAALDTERSRSVVELLGTLVRRRGLAAAMVTHDLDTLAPGTPRGVDDIYQMVDGALSTATVGA